MDPKVADFWLVSNTEGFGAFDDIIFWIEYTDKRKILYCIQLKHKDSKPIQVAELLRDKSKNSLKKYQDSYEEIVQNIDKIAILKDISANQIVTILCTTVSIAGAQTDSIILKSRDTIDLINTSSKSNSVFQIFNSATSKNPFKGNFLENFYVFECQASATQLDRLIKNEFYSHFQDIDNTVLITVVDYFAKWSVGKSGKITRIFKKDVQRMLLEFLLLPHCMEPSEVAGKEDEMFNLVNDTLTSFNVTAITRENLLKNIFGSIKILLEKHCGTPLNFQLSWNIHLSSQQTDNLMNANDQQEKQLLKTFLQARQRYVPYLTLKDVYLSAWQSRIVPLIINCNIYQNSVEEILLKFKEVAKDMSFVLLNPSYTADLMNDLTVFKSINDVKDGTLLFRNLDNTYVSLQGKHCMQLKRFREKTMILEQITPDVYMILVDGVLRIGETYEIENYYIKRQISRPMLRMEVLEKSNVFKNRKSLLNQHGDIFLMIECSNDIPYKYKNNTMELGDYLKSAAEDKVNDEIYILTAYLKHTNKIIIDAATHLNTKTKKSCTRDENKWAFIRVVIFERDRRKFTRILD
ncbi:hypothetical protein NQ314_000022 [Rhamnusium bicolor]|uniref:Uncharacterized protein n=1 Tax=Rhamnusium bicolor TaxID=1586634 RepID=A0AAV8ZY02_9CUCU|nr:hypothetical protein NQ314_000022 [Rhamnusium bicolor]